MSTIFNGNNQNFELSN